MSSPILNTLKNTAAIASAALFIQIGSAAAASPRGDFQQQVRQVLTGTLVAAPTAHRHSGRPGPLDRSVDTQVFVQRLLLGVSVSHPTATESIARPQRNDAIRVAMGPTADEDAQASVRQVLLGEHASSRGAL